MQLQLDAGDAAAQGLCDDANSPWILARDAQGRLQLSDARQPRQRPLCLELDGPEVQRRAAEGKKGLLPKALGFKRSPWHILDLTAGLGRDMATCALLGMQVTACERHPLMRALLADALERAEPRMRAQITLLPGTAEPALWQSVDAVAYDPMYPGTQKQAAQPALALQQLRALVGADSDVEALFAQLRQAPPKRLAVKRPPRGASVQLAPAQVEFRGKAVHWAVYLEGA